MTASSPVIFLPSVTLLCINCVEVKHAVAAIERCKRACQFGAVKLLTNLPTDYSHKVQIEALSSLQMYSDFMLTRAHEFVETQHALVVQHDGYIVNPKMWTSAFLSFDYIGAPWSDGAVGNGGFSLRSKVLMARVADLCQKFSGTPAVVVESQGRTVGVTNEDVVICRGLRSELERAGFAFAPASIAARFSVEEGYDVTRAFGLHGTVALERWQALRTSR